MTEGEWPEAQHPKPGPTGRTQFLESRWGLGLGLCPSGRGSKSRKSIWVTAPPPTTRREKQKRKPGPSWDRSTLGVLLFHILRDNSFSGPRGFDMSLTPSCYRLDNPRNFGTSYISLFFNEEVRSDKSSECFRASWEVSCCSIIVGRG